VIRNISVTVHHSDLHETEYQFWINDLTLYLDKMLTLRRETKRHKFKVNLRESYSRLMAREYGIKEEPDLDIEVQDMALSLVRQKLKIKRWEDK
jgi:hypothetical protein